jgi:biopolymer transport protein ExbD
MMVIAPSFQSVNNSITMPEINSGAAVEQKNAEVAITKDGVMYLNGTPVKNLVAELTQLRSTLDVPELVVKADEKVKSSKIMEVMDAAQDAEFKKLTVAGEPLSKKEQKELNNEQ